MQKINDDSSLIMNMMDNYVSQVKNNSITISNTHNEMSAKSTTSIIKCIRGLFISVAILYGTTGVTQCFCIRGYQEIPHHQGNNPINVRRNNNVEDALMRIRQDREEQEQRERDNIRREYLSPDGLTKLKKEANKIKTMYDFLKFVNRFSGVYGIRNTYPDIFREICERVNLNDRLEYILSNISKTVKGFKVIDYRDNKELWFRKSFFWSLCSLVSYSTTIDKLRDIFDKMGYDNHPKIQALFERLRVYIDR